MKRIVFFVPKWMKRMKKIANIFSSRLSDIMLICIIREIFLPSYYKVLLETSLVIIFYMCITLHTIFVTVVCCRCDGIFKGNTLFMKAYFYKFSYNYSSTRAVLYPCTNQYSVGLTNKHLVYVFNFYIFIQLIWSYFGINNFLLYYIVYHMDGYREDNLVIHTGNEPNYCNLCDKAFIQIDIHLDHMRLHTGDKLHLCRLCDRAFSQRDNFIVHAKINSCVHLIDHLGMHNGEKPCQCRNCGNILSVCFVRKKSIFFIIKRCSKDVIPSYNFYYDG